MSQDRGVSFAAYQSYEMLIGMTQWKQLWINQTIEFLRMEKSQEPIVLCLAILLNVIHGSTSETFSRPLFEPIEIAALFHCSRISQSFEFAFFRC
jgi:hypothetical protein